MFYSVFVFLIGVFCAQQYELPNVREWVSYSVLYIQNFNQNPQTYEDSKFKRLFDFVNKNLGSEASAVRNLK